MLSAEGAQLLLHDGNWTVDLDVPAANLERPDAWCRPAPVNQNAVELSLQGRDPLGAELDLLEL